MPGVRRIAVLIMIVLGVGVLPAVGLSPAGAAPDGGAFTRLGGFEPSGAKVRVQPKTYSATKVDFAALRAELPAAGGSTVVSVPDPSGALNRFRVQRTQIMESDLAAAHPELATYSGRGVDDPLASIALDLTPMGFHASVRAPGGQRDWYVDPAYNGRATTQHLSYYGADLPTSEQRRREGQIAGVGEKLDAARDDSPSAAPGSAIGRKVFRLALTSDPSYAAYFGVDNVLAEKVTLMNRVNQVYNDDMAITMRLVNATDSLNFDTDAEATGPDGPCGSAPCFSLYDDGGTPDDDSDDIPGGLDYCDSPALGENRNLLGLLVGASNYDIGHLALGVNGGGVAFLGVVGGDYKASGCTGLPQPKGDFFAIDYVAHEMGHQFAGNHTFNGTQYNCSGGNREPATSVEPGSGSSVMAYAGICRQDNLQAHSDPYFSQRSVDEVNTYTEAAPYANIEVQTVSLRAFDGTDSINISYDGSIPVTLTRGDSYTAADIEAAVEFATGADVSIAQWGFDEFGYRPDVTEPDDQGFQVIFNDEPTVIGADETDLDFDNLTVTGNGDVTTLVGEVAQGGPSFNGGVATVASGNLAPVVTAPADRTLPMRTPFALTGSGTDADGDPLLYLWEQNDVGGATGTALVSNTKTDGPLFRVFGTEAMVSTADSLQTPSPHQNNADGSATRVFPDMAQILSGNTNAASGVCPTAPPVPVPFVRVDPVLTECYSEYLPKAGYVGTAGSSVPAMHFRLTARDLFPTGGGLASDDVTLTLDPTAGPFLVTSQTSAGSTAHGGAATPVTWAVNNTQGLAPSVRITLSTDGGQTFGTVLAASTPNDGAETVTMPNVSAADVRIRIEAVDNYFFDVNDASFALVATPAPGVPDTTITAGPAEDAIVLEEKQAFAYTSSVVPATFVCQVDGDTVPCAAAGTERRFGAGTHVFSVAAVNSAGVADATPATRTFTVPLDDGKLVRKGQWKRVKNKAAYGNDYVKSRVKGSRLVTPIRDVTRIALVVGTRKNAGSVKVFVGDDRVKKFSLKGKNRTKRLRTVVFDSPQSGKLRIYVGKNKPVRIEGVATVTDPS